MKIRTLGILALAAFAATACKKGDNDTETTTADTAVVPGSDTVPSTTVVPTQDSVVTTTTTTTETDTTHGDAGDTTVHDTTKKM